MIEIQHVSLDAAPIRNRRLTDAAHLLSAVQHMLDKLPEDVQELSVFDDIAALIQQAEAAIKDARAVDLPPIPVAA